MIELLSPVGDFECLKAAVQNGADAVYFGANLFSARAFAKNFDLENLEKAINYAKLRGVKTNLTLNTLIKDDEFEDAVMLAKKAYEFGIDAIIVQDLGLATTLIKNFPNLPIHASTQMTIHNLDGALEAEKLGFKRAVLSRELPINEIEYICKNSNIEIEVFIHGALCISYSGQCLFSSMIGGRSGNRGKCAQPCRLPYELLEDDNKIDSGYLLSTRDLCGLEFLPQLINCGVKCLKIEGRMKNPQYVATVTRIYRKYIDLVLNNKPYIIDENDKKDLLQAFNRGGFSNGHLSNDPNKKLVFKEKQNNMGIYLGKIKKFNSNKGLITLTLNDNLEIGDSIFAEKETSNYTISELMKNDKNIKQGIYGETVTFGRMKGNINIGDKIYKTASKKLTSFALESFSKEFKKIHLDCNISIKQNENINIYVKCLEHNIESSFVYNYIPLPAENKPLDKEKIIQQFSKTTDTPFEFSNLNIILDNNIFIPVSILNDLRRTTINNIEKEIISSFKHTSDFCFVDKNIKEKNNIVNKKISLLLNELNVDLDYTNLIDIDNIYIPLKYFYNKKYTDVLSILSNKFNIYIYLPNVLREKYINNLVSILNTSISQFNIKGLILSNIFYLNIINKIDNKNLDLVANYTLNVFNKFSVDELKSFGFTNLTISPELNKNSIINICNYNIDTELIVYGNTPLMTTNYCLLGTTNSCYKDCSRNCSNNKKYYLKDRLGLKFRIIPDNLQTITTIYNSKTTSISYEDFNVNSLRIDVLDESIETINKIISCVKSNTRFEGKDYTNGNLNKEI